jgi:hypothetical protein
MSDAIQTAAAAQMYRALANSPCGCCRRWNREEADEYTITKVCGRCLAMRAYEAATGAPVMA